MRKAFVALLLLCLGVAVMSTVASAREGTEPSDDPSILRATRGLSDRAAAYHTQDAGDPDTVWIGHVGSTFLGMGKGGVWDFDAGSSTSDSTQGWQRYAMQWRSNGTAAATARLEWAYDYGNQINEGNTNLWANRDNSPARSYVKTGCVSAWHADDMVGVKQNLSNGGEPTAVPITGTRSAWCGLRQGGYQDLVNGQAKDPLTGNWLTGDLQIEQGTTNRADFPGYCNGWDQMLYKDFASTGTGSVKFTARVDVSNFIDAQVNGTGWFNPEPLPANFVNNPADSFMVYVGSPREALVYDTNRRWFSEVLDFSKPVQELFATSQGLSVDTVHTIAYAGITPVGGDVRLVFRVKTNRVRSDQTTGTATGFNSKQGAALVDEVSVDGGTVYHFENVSDIKARSQISNLVTDPAWAATGKPPSVYLHVDNISSLLYEDLCGGVGTVNRRCNLVGNVLAAGDHDNGHHLTVEAYQIVTSPTINCANRGGPAGVYNGQGIDGEIAARQTAVIDYDFYSGFMGLDQSIFYRFAARGHGPFTVAPQSGNRIWSNAIFYPFIIFNPDPFCYRERDNISALGVPIGSVDSLQAVLGTISQGFRFGGTDLGNTRGTYWDNVRVGLIRGASPQLAQEIWNKYQDSFSFNEGVAAGTVNFDTTTALMTSGLNIVDPPNTPGVVAGDTILANSPFTGDGVTDGVRMDLIFRIDPGPGNYVTKGVRASGLRNIDAVHPFFASYLANNGPAGTPAGHGGSWNPNVWNSARMDSAESNIWPIQPRGIGGPGTPVWMGTLHEAEYTGAGLRNTLGISHAVCFLLDPAGAVSSANIICDGVTIPPGYDSWAYANTKEGTKILPDGWFTPGTHIEYFLRRTTLIASGVDLLFDTTKVFPQDPGGNDDFDAERWSNVDVLPDLWKDPRFSTEALTPQAVGVRACILMIDGNDRRGADPQYRGAADSTGFGKNNGATAGWKDPGTSSTFDPNDPSGFVAANKGQYGLAFDHYDIRASESDEGGHPGMRLITPPGALAGKQAKNGPTPAMLATYYNTIIWMTGDLNTGTLHDAFDPQEGADDLSLLTGYLAGASGSNQRGIWLSGDGIMDDAWNNSDDGTHLYPFLTDNFGADFTGDNYKARSGSIAITVGFLPTASWAHPGRHYGFNHLCLVIADVLATVPTTPGATEAAQYEHLGPAPWTASVYRPAVGGTREYKTLMDGFDLSNLRGIGPLGDIGQLSLNDVGRRFWFDDVLEGHFALCARRGPVVDVGDGIGIDGSIFANKNLGAFPNPAFASNKVTLKFTLAKAQNITVRIYNVAGREVSRLTQRGVAGPNTVLWNGTLSSGIKAAPGVYFYSVDGIEFARGSAPSKMILLGSNQ